MLYLMENTFRPQLLTGELDHLIEPEHKMLLNSYENGSLVRLWRKASGTSGVLVIKAKDHDELRDWIKSMPMFPYFETVKVTPLTCHPKFQQFALSDKDLKEKGI
jgi:muconolactone delta-isomerase